MSGAYDERLLASAPAATRAEKQEGYNIDLLDDRHAAPTSHTPPPVPVLSANHTKAEAGGYAYPPPARLPWYKTRKWIFIMALGTVVVLAAVIGGAVGGTVGHSNKNAAATNGTATSTGGGGAAGPAVTEGAGAGTAATTTAGESPASAASAALSGNHR